MVKPISCIYNSKECNSNGKKKIHKYCSINHTVPMLPDDQAIFICKKYTTIFKKINP